MSWLRESFTFWGFSSCIPLMPFSIIDIISHIFFHEEFFLYVNFQCLLCLYWIFIHISHMRLPLSH
jgi:hypothetical protein